MELEKLEKPLLTGNTCQLPGFSWLRFAVLGKLGATKYQHIRTRSSWFLNCNPRTTTPGVGIKFPRREYENWKSFSDAQSEIQDSHTFIPTRQYSGSGTPILSYQRDSSLRLLGPLGSVYCSNCQNPNRDQRPLFVISSSRTPKRRPCAPPTRAPWGVE
jgi:hypothetical protein